MARAFVGLVAAASLILLLSVNSANAQEPFYRGKTVRIIVGASAGGGYDTYSRTIARHMGKHIPGNPVFVVVNMPGAGYKGTADVRLAFDGGEVTGICNSWESFKSTWRKELDAGELVLVLQNVAKPHPELPKIPLAINYAKTDEAQRLIRALVHSVGPTARPYLLPPGTPKDRVQILRKAFIDTMKDPEFLADATKAKLDLNPLDGAELERNVREVFNLDKALIPRAKEILK